MDRQTAALLVALAFVAVIGGYLLLQGPEFRQPEALVGPGEQAYLDSPFGAHGAFSRPFIESDGVAVDDVLRRVSLERAPYRHVQDVGIRWVRPGADIYWGTVQPTAMHIDNGLFEWGPVDDMYGRVPYGVNILGTIDALPWGVNRDPAFEPGTWSFAGRDAEGQYARFVEAVVERYDGDGRDDMPGLGNPIRYWQVGNEPAARPSSGVGDLSTRFDWQGFARLVEVSYAAIKRSDPGAKIVLGGMASGYAVGNDSFARRELEEFYFPLLGELRGRYVSVFDVHYYGSLQKDLEALPEGWQWKSMGSSYLVVRRALDRNGFRDAEIWFTETAVPSSPLGERFQAVSLVKRYVYALSLGAKKVFWWNMVEGEYPLEVDKPNNHFGLVYDGIGKGDPGYGVKKLSYYSYKKLIETLGGSGWGSVQAVREGGGVYAYRFSRQGRHVWVAWSEDAAGSSFELSGVASRRVRITGSVPRYASGGDVTDYGSAFDTVVEDVRGGKVSVAVGEVPLFVEEE